MELHRRSPVALTGDQEAAMPRGDKPTPNDRRKNAADPIAGNKRGVSKQEAARREWTAVNKDSDKQPGFSRRGGTGHPSAEPDGKTAVRPV
jgi:hypothetical protein